MKKQKTEVKKLRVDKETLLPLGSHPMKEVAGGGTWWVHWAIDGTQLRHDTTTGG
jgi:hypothetical protein